MRKRADFVNGTVDAGRQRDSDFACPSANAVRIR
jgi:hypothetical protein